MPQSALKKYWYWPVFVVGAVALVRDTFYQGQDFEVMWHTTQRVWNHQPAYDLIRDGAMTYKYPPWILPAVFPLGFFSLQDAKLAWGIIQVLSIVALARWCLRRVSFAAVTSCLLLFWGLWAVHAMDGQITIPILALLLWANEIKTGAAAVLALWGSSVKIFTGIFIFGMPWIFERTELARRTAISLMVLLVSSLPVLMSFDGVTVGDRAAKMLMAWKTTAGSSSTHFDESKTRGRDNQGLPALALRTLGVPATNKEADLLAFAVLSVLLGVWWHGRSKALSEDLRFTGWIALAAALHPLAWFHHFTLAIPFAVLCAHEALEWRIPRGWTLLGIACLALVTRKTLGPAGAGLELLSIKSVGVLILLRNSTHRVGN